MRPTAFLVEPGGPSRCRSSAPPGALNLTLKQKQLADRVQASPSVIPRIESDQCPTSVATLRRLADAFETHLVHTSMTSPCRWAALGTVTAVWGTRPEHLVHNSTPATKTA